VPGVGKSANNNKTTKKMEIIAQITGDIGAGITAALGCFAAALGVAMVGTKAVEAVGRNPGASTKILVQSIIGMALAEAVAFYSLFLY
jgi:F-type H+-transporting ATPase subunit c